jgi:hypothetical protein
MSFRASAPGDHEHPPPGVEAFGAVPVDPVQQRAHGRLLVIESDVGV